jgi:adenosylcobinamide-GDP ribazoletransferase
MTSTRTFLRSGRAATTFLTRFPVGGFPYTDDEWRWASAWFPAIGALLGALYGAIYFCFQSAGSLVAATLVVIAALMFTGAFHEDGLADTADALGGGYTRDRVLEILKDSRVGAFGAAALVVSLLLRVALISQLGTRAPFALILCECISRTPPIWLMAMLPYATDDAAAKSRLITRAGAAQALVATAWPATVFAVMLLWGCISILQAVVIIAIAVALTLKLASVFVDRVDGVTGDFLGATQQVLVCSSLLVLALL